MGYVFLVGGARSGKSRLAVGLAVRSGRAVTVVATATPSDDEMAARIARHAQERPADWRVVEEPLQLADVVDRVDPSAFVLVDCLTLWVSNMLGAGFDDPSVLAQAEQAVERLAGRPGPGVVVSNEVGAGIVPTGALARRFRDLLGSVNQIFADGAEDARLVVAGRMLRLERWDG